MRLFFKNSYLRYAELRRIRRIISEGIVDVQSWQHLVELIESSCRRHYLESRHRKPTEWMMFGDMQIPLGRGRRAMNFNVLRVGVTYNPFTKKVTVKRVRFSEPVAELRRQYYMSRGIFIVARNPRKPREQKPDDEVSPWDRPRDPAPPPRDVAHVGLRSSMESAPADMFQREPRTSVRHEPRLDFPKPVVKMRRPPWYHI